VQVEIMASQSPPQAGLAGPRSAFIQWLVIGVAGVTFLFVASAHLPDSIKLPGVLTIGLGIAAGWAWGLLGKSMHIAPNRLIAVIVGIAIAGAELLSAWKSHQDRAEYLNRKWQPLQNDPIAQAVRESLSQERDHETPSEREQRLKKLAELDGADAIRWKRLKFRGYLASRMERLKIRALMPAPWPELVWGIEILLGSALGAWLAVSVMQARPPQSL
jgi:hypothetical protein